MTTEHEDARSGTGLVLIGVVILAAGLALGLQLHGELGAAAPDAARTAQAAVVMTDADPVPPGVAASDPAVRMRLRPSAADPAAASEPSVSVDHGAVRFYFARGKAQLAAGADEALASVVKGVAAGKTAVISVYRAATDSDANDPQLVRERAQAVRGALMALGIGADKLVLRGVDETITAGTDAQAERVEVTLEG